MANYRIISFDGGGIRGILTCVLLERLVKEFPQLITKADLLSGTSTGGIIALGLAYGLSPTELRNLYYENADEIFDDSWLDDLKDLGKISGADYDNTYLRKILTKVFGATRLRDLKKSVLIPSFDLDNEDKNPLKRTWKPKFFHNFKGNDSDGNSKVVDIAMYTSAAPTYFPTADGFIDGGVVTNTPSVAAIAQTQDTRAEIRPRPKLDDLVLLSLGTGTSLVTIKGTALDWGYAQWAKPLIQLMLEGNMGVSDYQSEQLLGSRYHRLAPLFDPGVSIRLDEWRRRNDLIHIAEKENIAKTTLWLKKNW